MRKGDESNEPAAPTTVHENNIAPDIQNNVGMGQHSFLLDPGFLNDNYQDEAVMLTRLKALTNNFTCQRCWQVLTFARFFDEDHECLKKVDLAANGLAVKHS